MIVGTLTLLTILFLGGNGDFEYLLMSDGDKIMKEVIEDKDLQKKVFSELKPIRKSVAGHKVNVENSMKEISKMSMEYADQTDKMKAEFDKVMKEFKAAEYDIINARLAIAKLLPDTVWDDLMERTEGNFDERDIPDIETTVFDNIQRMEAAIEENIKDESRRTRIYTVLEQFKSDLQETMEQLLRASPSSNLVFREQSSDKIALEKAYYPLNSSLTNTFQSYSELYSKGRSMAMKSEWDVLITSYKAKAKSK